MRFCALIMMPIVLLQQERSLEIVEPKNVTESACKTSVPSMTRGWMGVFFLRKSMIISFVLDMFSTRLLFSGLRLEKKNYYREKLEYCKTNTRETWTILNNVIVKRKSEKKFQRISCW